MKSICTEENFKVGELRSKICLRDNVKQPIAPPEGYARVRVLSSGIAIDEIHSAENSFLGHFGSQPKRITAEQPFIPGLECCGVIEQINNDPKSKSGPSPFKVGDVVLSLQSPFGDKNGTGTWAEYANVPLDHMQLKPAHLSADEAIATVLTGFTCVAALAKAKPLLDSRSKPTVLICGATGSIGTLCLQACAHLFPTAKDIIGVCSSRSEDFAKSCGATRVMAYDKTPKWGASLRGTVDVVIDLVGGSKVEKEARIALSKGGRFVTMVGPVQYIGDKRLSKLALTGVAFKLIGKMASNLWRSSSYVLTEETQAPMDLWQQLQDEKVFQPRIERVVQFDDIDEMKDAMKHVSSHRSKGKIVIHIADE